MKIKLNAVRMEKKVIRHTDNTGKKLPQEMIERQEASPFRGRVTMELVTETVALLQFTVVVIERKAELSAFVVDQDSNGNPIFVLGNAVNEAAIAVALECMKHGKTNVDGRPLVSVEL